MTITRFSGYSDVTFYTDGTYTVPTDTYEYTGGALTVYYIATWGDFSGEEFTITATDENLKDGTSVNIAVTDEP